VFAVLFCAPAFITLAAAIAAADTAAGAGVALVLLLLLSTLFATGIRALTPKVKRSDLEKAQ
jgi:hypothetical protein